MKSDLHEQIEHLPQTISRLQTQLKTEQDKYANLLQLKPIIDQKIDLELKLPSKEECAVKLENDVASICVDIEARKISMTEPIAIQKHIAEIMPDIIILEETVKEVIVLQTDINTLKVYEHLIYFLNIRKNFHMIFGLFHRLKYLFTSTFLLQTFLIFKFRKIQFLRIYRLCEVHWMRMLKFMNVIHIV